MIAKQILCRSLMAALLGSGLIFSPVAGQSLISYDVATPVGLERAWFGQVQVDVSRHRVRHWKLDRDMLFALTSSGLLHAFNAETGETLWTAQPGPLDQAAAGPAVNDEFVAVVSGAELYVLDRASGNFLWSRPLGSAPAAAPALSAEVAYITFLNGRVEGYRLADPETFPWYSQSVGRIFHSPTVSGSVVSWPTSRGYLYVGQANDPRVLYRIETDSPATAPPSELNSYLYVTSADGRVYCFNALNGTEVWRYTVGYRASGRPAVVGERCYVASTEPMLHAVHSRTGDSLWSVPGIIEFAAQGLKQVYGLDEFGRLLIVDRETGRYVGTLPGVDHSAVFNEDSDRIYLVNDRGLVQCLHEIGADKPTMFRELVVVEETEEPASAEETQPVETQPEPTTPFSTEPAADDSPFSADEDAGSVFDDDPFGLE